MSHNNASLSLDLTGTRSFTGRQTAIWYSAVLAMAACADGISKALAVSFLTDHTLLLGSRFALMLVFNTAGAGGMSWGAHTWLINVSLTLFAVLMISGIVGQLARIDRRAALSLGLVAGGAIGNLVSMLEGPKGVADFIALRLGDRAIVCNVADIALWSGALLLAPVIVSLVRAIRVERATQAARSVALAGA